MREELKALAGVLAGREHLYMIGRGLQFATAKEAALKVKEVSYIHTEAFAGGELKHGPLALIEEGTPVFVFIGKGEPREDSFQYPGDQSPWGDGDRRLRNRPRDL